MTQQRTPAFRPRISRRLPDTGSNSLGPTRAFTNTAVRWALVPIAGLSSLTCRIKTATQGGTIDIFLVGPDFDVDQDKASTAYASLTGTIYTSGNPTQVAVVAGTEALITLTCRGEGYALVKFTGGGTGTITYADICGLPIAGR